jgi:5-methylcytosine-specific restriction enzyme A
VGFKFETGPDRNGSSRRLLIFNLLPVTGAPQTDLNESPPLQIPLDELRQRAYAAASQGSDATRSGLRHYYERSEDVRAHVLARASGRCEACGADAPFKRKDGTAYLEPHHTRRVSDGGPDHPRWVGAVYPSCHRRIHHGADGSDINQQLVEKLATIEVGHGEDAG